MRRISAAPGTLRSTSHAHCARKTSSSIPARTCGCPKRSRVKNLLINRERVFYHVGQGFRKNPLMGEPLPSPIPPQDEPQRPALHPPMSEHPVHKVFLGPSGLRAGWRLCVYLALVATMYVLLGWMTYY